MTEWISIKEQLPIQCEDVLLYSEYGISVGWLESDPSEDPVFAAQAFKYSYPENVTHWMHLPDKPKDS